MAIVKYAYGSNAKKTNYLGDGYIYIATDTEQLYAWGAEIGLSKADKAKLATVIASLEGLEGELGSDLAEVVKKLVVTSKDKTIKINTEGENTDLSVNIDGTTLVKDGSTGVISVAPSATAVEGENAIKVESVSGGKKITLVIDGDDDVLSQGASGLKTTLVLKYVAKTDGTPAKLQLLGVDDAVVSEIDATAFVKDGILSNAELKTGAQLNAGDEGSRTATNKYLVLTFNTDSGKEPIELDVTELIDIYTPGNGIDITANKVSIKLASTSDKYLKLTAEGLASNAEAIEGMVDDKIDAAIEEALGGEDAKPVDEQIEDAIDDLKEELTVETVGEAGKYIEAVSQTDGKLSATAKDLVASAVKATAKGFSSTNVQAALEELAAMWEWHNADGE